jgi:7,8-dihydropterin-6-yl-methyl-4-(beta-D-ribofuranosyl)aminobenzene 5'-phosphate synthase
MTVKITTLVENTSGVPHIHGEWGQSLFIETEENTILFDTGASDLIIENAARLGVDLSKIDKIVISHGHYDHTGGLQAVLINLLESGAKPNGIEIVAHPDIFQPKFVHIKDVVTTDIGIPFAREELEALGARFNLSWDPVQLNSFTTTTGEVAISVDYEKIDAILHIKDGNKHVPDPLADDLSIIINTDKGLIVLLGCAHRGIINTLNHAIQQTGISTIYAVIGGTHLVNADKRQLDATVAALKELKIEKLGCSHCTGLMPAVRLAREFEGSFFFNNAGTVTVL